MHAPILVPWVTRLSAAYPNDNDELFASTLYQAICVFCNAPSPPLPIRKLLLLLWKVLLVCVRHGSESKGRNDALLFQFTLGGLDSAFEEKNRARQHHQLEPIAENPAKIIARMPPISPPLAGAECLEMQGQADGGSSSSSARRAKRQVRTKTMVDMIEHLLIE